MAEPNRSLLELICGYWHTQAVYAVAQLRIADRLAAGPRTAEDLAAEAGVLPGPLYRLLRALASVGVFAEDERRCFRLTPMAEELIDRPGSKYAVALMNGVEHYRAWGDFLHSLQTGTPAFDHVYGQPCFDYLASHPEAAKVFDAAMTGYHGHETQAMLDAYDFTGIGTLVDVGGGNGTVLTTALRKHPTLKGILYDLANVVERARPNIEAKDLGGRCRAVAGSFFEAVPSGGDAYLMRHIIHDWTDAQCRTILGHIRKVIPASGRLLVIEMVLKPGNEPDLAKFLDLNMLALPGGQERTEAEYRALFASAGFTLTRIVPTPSPVSVLDARPA